MPSHRQQQQQPAMARRRTKFIVFAMALILATDFVSAEQVSSLKDLDDQQQQQQQAESLLGPVTLVRDADDISAAPAPSAAALNLDLNRVSQRLLAMPSNLLASRLFLYNPKLLAAGSWKRSGGELDSLSGNTLGKRSRTLFARQLGPDSLHFLQQNALRLRPNSADLRLNPWDFYQNYQDETALRNSLSV